MKTSARVATWALALALTAALAWTLAVCILPA